MSAAYGDRWRNYFDIVILPPPAVRDHAIALSKELERYESKFVLGKRRYIPHISLYHIPVRSEDFAAFSRTVQNIASRRQGGDLRLRSIDMPLLMTDKPKWLQQLHLDVVNQTSRYFDWNSGAKDSWGIEYLPANLRVRAKQYLEKFGSPMIDVMFRPHITLASFKDKRIRKDIPSPAFEPMAFRVDEVSICELGPSHSCRRVIAKYPLGAAASVQVTVTSPIQAKLKEARIARLATVDAEGAPRLVPVCFVYDGAVFYSAVDRKPKSVAPEKLGRLRRIQDNPNVALLIDEYSEDWTRLWYVQILGEARRVPPTARSERARALRQLREKYPQYAAGMLDDDAVIIKITPRRVTSWGCL